MPTVDQTLQDPEFTKLPLESRRRILGKIDPEFGKLGADSQVRILNKAAEPKPSNLSRFGGRALSTLAGGLNPMPPLRIGLEAAKNAIGLPTDLKATREFVEPQLEQFKKAGQMAKRTLTGDINPLAGAAGTLMYGAGGALPGYGPMITGAVEEGLSKERGGAGRVPEALGTLVGGAAAAPIIEYGTRGVGAVAKKAARPLYKSTLTFPEDVSLPARHKAVESGLEIGARTTEGPKGLPRAEQFIADMSARVDAEIAKAKAAGKQADIYPVLDEVDAMVKKYGKSAAPTEAKEAATRIQHDVYARFGQSVVNVAGPGGRVVKQAARTGPRFMDPELMQEAKRATSEKLTKAYGDVSSPAKETEKAAERGMKESMEQIADVKDPNWQEHVAIRLKDAMERTLKRQPAFLDRYGMYILGTGMLGTGFELGRGSIGGAAAAGGGALASLVIEKALRNPATLSRLAIALDRAGTLAPDVAKTLRITPAMTLGRSTTPPLPESRFVQQQQQQ